MLTTVVIDPTAGRHSPRVGPACHSQCCFYQNIDIWYDLQTKTKKKGSNNKNVKTKIVEEKHSLLFDRSKSDTYKYKMPKIFDWS